MAASNRLMLVAAKPGLSIRPVARDSLLGLHTSFWQSSGETCASGLAATTRRDDPACILGLCLNLHVQASRSPLLSRQSGTRLIFFHGFACVVMLSELV